MQIALKPLALALSVAWTSSAFASPEGVESQLLEQSRQWEEQLRDDLARQPLNKVLRTRPTQPEALARLGEIEIRAQNHPRAEKLLAQLKATAPDSPSTRQLDLALRLATTDAEKVNQARALTRTGKPAEALALWDTLLGGITPEGQLAVEYWQTVANLPNGWARAYQGLHQLIQREPSRALYRLARAQLALQKNPIAPEVLTDLDRLSRAAGNASDRPRGLWRRAILQGMATPAGLPSIRAYLALVPKDDAVKARYDDILKQETARLAKLRDPAYQAIEAARKSIGAGTFSQAKTQLATAAARYGSTPEWLGLSGELASRQGEFDQAEVHFRRGLAQEPDNQKAWQTRLQGVQLDRHLAAAEAARLTQDWPRAEAEAKHALRLRPNDAGALLGMARILTDQGRHDHAEALLKRALKNPDGANRALVALTEHQLQQGNVENARRLLLSLSPAQRKTIGAAYAAAQARVLRADAEAIQATGDLDAAIALYAQAITLTPDDPWLRFAYANTLKANGEPHRAAAALNALLKRPQPTADSRFAYALFRASQDDNRRALTTLEAIPAAGRTPSMVQLQQRVWLRETLRLAQTEAEHGQTDAAQTRLAQAEKLLHANAPALMSLAEGWQAVSPTALPAAQEKALALAEQAVKLAAPLTPALQLRHAAVLAEAGNTAAAQQHLARLGSDGLTPEDKLQRDALDTRLALAHAEQATTAGHPDEARATLQALAQRQPNQPRVLRAVARQALDDNRPAEALAAATQAAQLAPEDAEARLTLADSQIAHGQPEAAKVTLDALLARQPAYPLAIQIRAIDRLSTLGDEAGVSAHIARLSSRNPRHPLVLTHTARQARQTNAPDTAEQHYRAALYQLAPPSTRAATPPVLDTIAPPPPTAAATAASPLTAPSTAPVLLELAAPPTSTVVPLPAVFPAASGRPALVGDYTNTLRPPPVLNTLAPPATPSDAPVLTQLARLPPAAALLPDLAGGEALRGEYADFKDRRTGEAQVGMDFSARQSTAGKSSQQLWETPTLVSLPAPYDGKWFARAEPTQLSVGSLPLSNATERETFGSMLLCSTGCATTGSLAQEGQGTAFALGYQNDHLRVDVGSTPQGFAVQNVTGGAAWSGKLGGIGYTLDASRRPLNSTLLSYGGTRDPRTGEVWGGVVQTGATVSLSYDQGGAVGLWGNLGWHQLTGRNVADNTRTDLMGGGYWRAINTPTQRLQLGLNAVSFGYDKNLSEFTLGHGGYYSPQTYHSVSVPVTWMERGGRWTYLLRGGVSYSQSRTDSSPFFPTRPDLQAAAQALGGRSPVFAGSRSAGVGLSLAAAAEYQVAPRWVVGGQVALEKSDFYQPSRASLYLRYQFEPSPKLLPFPPEPLTTYSRF